jgi:hypothetical protein
VSHWIERLFKKNIQQVPEIMLYLKILHLDEPMDLISSDLNLIPSDSIIPDSVLRELASIQEQLWKDKFELNEEECLALRLLIKHQCLTSRELAKLLETQHIEIALIDGWLHRLIRKVNTQSQHLIRMKPQGFEIAYQWTPGHGQAD